MRNSVSFQISVPLTAETKKALASKHPERVIEGQMKQPAIINALRAEVAAARNLGMINTAESPKGAHAKAEHHKAPQKGIDLVG
jgi:hypothetical protein